MYNSVIAACLVLDVRGTAICLAIDFAAINLKETLASKLCKGRNEITNKTFLHFKIKCRQINLSVILR